MWDLLSPWLDDFLSAFAAAVREKDEEHHLIATAKALIEIESVAQSANRLRPWISVWRAIDQVIDQLFAVARNFLLASAAGTPIDAQRKAEEAQRAIDDATAALAAIEERLDRWNSIADEPDPDRALSILAGEAYKASGANNIFDLDDSGARRYLELTGREVCPPGLGIGMQLTSIQVETVLDEERFWDVSKKVYELLLENAERLKQVTASPNWTGDYREASMSSHDAGVALQAVLAGTRRDRVHVGALLSLGLDLIEGPGKRYIATILGAIGRTAYDQLRTRDAGALLINAQQRDLTVLMLGLERSIRVARAHREFRVEDGIVLFTARGSDGERMTIAELVDRVLSGLESILALSVGILCAAIEVGVPLEEMDPVEDLGLDPEDSCALALAFAGWDNPRVEFDGGLMTASGNTEISSRTMNVIAMLLLHAPTHSVDALLRVSTRSGTRILAGPLSPFREWREESDETLKSFFFLEGLASWTLDGVPIIDRDYVRKFVAVSAAQSLQTDLPQAIRETKALRDLAQRIEDSDLAQATKGLLSQLRARHLDLPEMPTGRAGAEQIRRWLDLTVTPPFE